MRSGLTEGTGSCRRDPGRATFLLTMKSDVVTCLPVGVHTRNKMAEILKGVLGESDQHNTGNKEILIYNSSCHGRH